MLILKKERKRSINMPVVRLLRAAVGNLPVYADETLWLCVAELGRDALPIQAAPHDPGAGLQ